MGRVDGWREGGGAQTANLHDRPNSDLVARALLRTLLHLLTLLGLVSRSLLTRLHPARRLAHLVRCSCSCPQAVLLHPLVLVRLDALLRSIIYYIIYYII